MTTVSKSVDLVYGVRKRISASGLALVYDTRLRVSKTDALQYGTREVVSPGKVLDLRYGVRRRVSSSYGIKYWVRVPIASSKTVSLVYGIRTRVQKNEAIQYDTGATGTTSVSKSLEISYHTLITPSSEVIPITVAVPAGGIPPQIVTTSF